MGQLQVQCNALTNRVLLCSRSLLPAIVSALLRLSPLSFPVTGNSHNCRPKCLNRLQEAARTSLAETECSVPVGVCQSPANKGCCSPPQSFCYIHSKQEVKNLNAAIAGAASLKLADMEVWLTSRCCELGRLIWSFPFNVSKPRL